ncbi:helix-turn-helix domain-containing protein, partial [Escherichia ruysiae]|uniref:helix-turn-helix domain-containing protein n=1 Tax=Escherichia ruysiae TaxID=2608867 RepID=UPI0034D96891
MTRAERALRNPQVSVAAVAEQMGYETEAAFRKAFKRVHGVGPSATGPRIAHAPWRS